MPNKGNAKVLLSGPPLRAAKGAVKQEVTRLLAAQPDREWRFEEVTAALFHMNPGSVQACLSDLHRRKGSPVHRVAAGTYTWGDEFSRKVKTIADPATTDLPLLKVGDMLEVVGFLSKSKMLVLGGGDRLWVLSEPTADSDFMRGKLVGEIPKG